MRVLIVKVSSLGDVIHTLPALTDAKNAIPEIVFDWVVEESFTEIPAWHPAVGKVIPVAFRRWRRKLFSLFFNPEFKQFRRELKESNYDLVIDAQGLLKSGLICSMVSAKKAGLDRDSIREKIACRFYDETFNVSWQQHAVQRTRELFARALGYTVKGNADYGIDLTQFKSDELIGKRNLLFLHGTTWETKLWPEAYWQELAALATREGKQVNLLWGNKEEKGRAQKIAERATNVKVIDRQSLTGIAILMCQSEGIIAVDTGLAHLAAALGRPTLSLYGASDAKRTGTYGANQKHLQATLTCSPCLKRVCEYQGDDLDEREKASVFSVQPPCFSTVPPSLVWQELRSLVPQAVEI
jgi:heptosyltransferase-1